MPSLTMYRAFLRVQTKVYKNENQTVCSTEAQTVFQLNFQNDQHSKATNRSSYLR